MNRKYKHKLNINNNREEELLLFYNFSFKNCQLFYLSALIFLAFISTQSLAWILRPTMPFKKKSIMEQGRKCL
jgi:HKD family nuclease